MMHSLKARLSLSLIISLAVIFLLQWWLVVGAIHRLGESYVVTRLEHDMDQLLATLSFQDNRAVLDASSTGLIYHKPLSGHYFRLQSGEQVLRSRSLWDTDLSLPALPPGEQDIRRIKGPQGQKLLALSHGFLKRDHTLTLTVAEDLTSLHVSLGRFARYYALFSIILALALLAIQAGLVHLGLRPLARMRVQLQSLEHGEIRELDTHAPTEIRPLVLQLNRLLATLAARLERSRKATGNLAHAMKTPLSVITNLADHTAVKSDPTLRDTLLTQTDTLRRLTDRELTRARLAGSGGGGQRLDLAIEVPKLVKVLDSLYASKRLTIDTRLPTTTQLPLDREDLLELLGNLLDNACKWSRQHVLLTISRQDNLEIIVEDDGPGCDNPVCAKLAERGRRADENTAGHGLGLAIVHDIVSAYGGTLHLGRSQNLGGFRALISLPLTAL